MLAAVLALASCHNTTPSGAVHDLPMGAASSGSETGPVAQSPDTMPRIVSMESDTLMLHQLKVPPVGSIERARRVNWVVEPVRVALSLSIGIGPEPGQLRVFTTLRNVEPERVELFWGSCSFVLRAYRKPDLRGRPAWDSRKWMLSRGQRGFDGMGCEGYAAGGDLVPGDSLRPREFRWHGRVQDVLGDSLPEGRYYLQAEIQFRADTLKLPAGSVQLGFDNLTDAG